MFYSQIVGHNIHIYWVRVDELFVELKRKFYNLNPLKLF